MKKFLKPYLDKLPYIRDLRKQINKQGTYPAGHYYSPIPNKAEALSYINCSIQEKKDLSGIHLNDNLQHDLLRKFVQYYDDLPFPEKINSQYRYYYDNSFYTYSDAIFLYSFLRRHEPEKVIEIGSGFSSAVILDTVDSFFSHKPEITFIEPDTSRLEKLLKNDDGEIVNIIESKIRDISPDFFSSLQAGDLLFIDSSHVVKCGSDLHYLFFEIMPSLSDGVFIHFHDIFYPFEYPAKWLEEGRYWNENYFLRAFLTNNTEWEIIFFNTYVAIEYSEIIEKHMPLCTKNPGGSIYIQKCIKS